jgi:hypothetical protein
MITPLSCGQIEERTTPSSIAMMAAIILAKVNKHVPLDTLFRHFCGADGVSDISCCYLGP